MAERPDDLDRDTELAPDFALLVRDVSSHRWSKARRLIGTMSLGLFGEKSGDVRPRTIFCLGCSRSKRMQRI